MKDNYKEDLRVLRTRKLLARSLFELLETTPFDKITVVDICDNAMVHRATFYNHFESKEHLLDYAIEEIKEDLFLSTYDKEHFNSIKDLYLYIIGKVLDFIEEHKAKILLILNQNSFEKAAEFLMSTIKRSLVNLMSNFENTSYENAIPKSFLINYFSGSITMICLNWLISPQAASKEELIKYFYILLNDEITIK